jgi:hypothetical protein
MRRDGISELLGDEGGVEDISVGRGDCRERRVGQAGGGRIDEKKVRWLW